jgi:hypothetical protein
MTAPALVAATSLHRARLAAGQLFRANLPLASGTVLAINFHRFPKMHLYGSHPAVAKEGL